MLTSDLGPLVYENLRDFIIREGARLDTSPATATANAASSESSSGKESMPAHLRQESVRQSLAVLQTAYEEQVVHIVGKEQMRIDEVKQCTGYFRKIALAAFLWLRSNAGNKVANMDLDGEKLVEVGFVKTI